MSNDQTTTCETASLIEQLREAAGRVDQDDLSLLAKMHGWAEQLASNQGSEDSNNPAILSQAKSIGKALEEIILNETPNPIATLKACIATIHQLGETTAGGAPSPAAQAAVPQIKPYVSEPLQLDPKELEFVKGFAEEAVEHLTSVEAAILEVEKSPSDTDKINDLFRPIHTIKGMAGFLNLRDVTSLAHEVETLLDQGRKGVRVLTPDLIDLVFQASDLLKVQINAVSGWVASPNEEVIPMPPVSDMIGRIKGVVAGAATVPVPAESPPKTATLDIAPEVETPPQETAAPAPIPVAAAPLPTPNDAPPSPAKGMTASPAAAPANAVDQSVRIDTGKLDALIDMVGELVIAQTQVAVGAGSESNERLSKEVAQVTKIVRDLQEVSMSLRMAPIGPTFQRMSRLVRDVSRKLNKQVELTISGEDTELDKNVIQLIGDPLVHMVRNSIDHGIEPAEIRTAAGKPAVGQIHLGAYHQGGNIVIEIRDDGKGLNREILFNKAVEKGLVQPTDVLTDQQVFSLIFAAGFSTAAQVTDVSGRGVGMDVVRRSVEQLRGRIDIASEAGVGSSFFIRLPLTLAIIDGMVVRVGKERFIIPTISIRQAVRPDASSIQTVQHRGEVLNFRGQLVPIIPLGSLYGLTPKRHAHEAMIVVAENGERQIGLVVDELIGQQQVVIKSLGARFKSIQGVSGAAILGDGRVGLILEMAGLAKAYQGWGEIPCSVHGSPATLPTTEHRSTTAECSSRTAIRQVRPANAELVFN